MSNIPLAIAENDVAVVHVPVAAPGDKRILKAEELTLGQRLLVQPEKRIESGWLGEPELSFVDDLRFRVEGSLRSGLFRRPLAVVGEVELPALSDTVSTVERDDFLSLVVFLAEVGIVHDATIRVTDVEEEMDNNGNLTGLTVINFDGENTRRYRLFWGLLYAETPPSVTGFWETLTEVDTVNDGLRELAIATGDSVATEGFALGDMRFYPVDSHLAAGLTYGVVNGMVEVFPLAAIVRRQNFLQNGYIWGKDGEESLSVDFCVKKLFRCVDWDGDTAVVRRCYEIMGGIPGQGFCYGRAVKNLFNGLASAPSEDPGELTRSPNGSYLVTNGQRVGLLNQRMLQGYYVQFCQSQYEIGDGDVIVTANMNTDVPISTQFGDGSTHRVFDAQGVEQTHLGEFVVPSGYNTLTWIAGINSSFYAPTPGSFVSKTAFFVPGIFFAAGSGFSEFFVGMEQVIRNGVPLSSANIREGTNDLDQYVDPANNESFIAIWSKERASLLRVYKKLVLTADETGKVFVPNTENGLFAFVQGKINPTTGGNRLDSVMEAGFSPNQANIKALIYYPLRSAGEQWQVRLKVSPYQGVGSTQPINEVVDFLQGAKVISRCRFFVHTLGGGGSCFHGDGALQFLPVSFALPAVAGGTPSYELNGPIHFAGQGYPGPVNFMEIPPLSATNYALPTPGMTLSTLSRSPLLHPRSLNIALFNQGGVPLGFGTPSFVDVDNEFQFVLCFAVEKDGDRRLVIATYNGGGGASYPLDSAENTAIDLFYC